MSRSSMVLPSVMFAFALTGHALAESLKVVASIKPVHSLVAAVMEGVGSPELIVKGAGSPHTYSMRPSEAAAVDAADIVFWVGETLEPFLKKPLETLGSGSAIVELSKAHGLTTLPYREGGPFEAHVDEGEAGHAAEEGHADDHDQRKEAAAHDHDHAREEHGHGAIDMHLWLDPANARAWVHEIEEALAKADPANAERYAANAEAVTEKIAKLETEIAAEIAPVKGKAFIVFHDAYQYFESRFGIAAAGSITVSPEVAPGAQRVAEIRARIVDAGAACVFAEPQFEPRIVSTVIEGTGARAGVLDPEGAALVDGPDLYFDLLRSIAASLKTCLSGSS